MTNPIQPQPSKARNQEQKEQPKIAPIVERMAKLIHQAIREENPPEIRHKSIEKID